MSDSNEYKLKSIDGHDKVAVIELARQVLGGNDAMIFTSRIQESAALDIDYLIIDMKPVELINSSGLGMLVSGLSTLRKHEINMMLISPPDKVLELLKMTHLDKVFQIYESVDVALNNCK